MGPDISDQRRTVTITYTRAIPDHPGRPSRLTTELLDRIAAMRKRGLTLRQIAAQLSSEDVPSATGKTTWSASMVAHALQMHRKRQQEQQGEPSAEKTRERP